MTQPMKATVALQTNPIAYRDAIEMALAEYRSKRRFDFRNLTVFGINGPAGSGKTTLFRNLQNRYGTSVVYASPSRATYDAVREYCDWFRAHTYDEIKSMPNGRESLIALWEAADEAGNGAIPIVFALSQAAQHKEFKSSSIVLYDSIGRDAELLTLAGTVNRVTCLRLRANVHGIKPRIIVNANDPTSEHWEGDSRSPALMPNGVPGNVTFLSASTVQSFNKAFPRGWSRLEPIVRGVHLING